MQASSRLWFIREDPNIARNFESLIFIYFILATIAKKFENLFFTKFNLATIAGVGTGFVQSKWEVVDDEDVKNEAVTSAEIFAETKRIETHKLEQMDDKKDAKPMYLQVK